ncbi:MULTISPECIES: GNAT family N-acetyltransferase [unclassified Paenibacillus]|uniref:GNAT family N-acetyltransferase n=2 Tax=Paenibacillus TaxID=44249 RepID=UPI00069440AA|nr:GNAT family N-acetyltransferase [Paenibacillus sp. FSL R5-0345]
MLFRKAIATDIPQLIEFRKILLSHEDNSSMDETFRNYFDSSLSDKSLVVWVAYMTNVFTIPNYRRQGIVSKLVSEAIDDLKAQGIRKILLHSSDMAKPMYESLGFVEGKNYMSINI